jgi:hypothetical protein
MYCFHQRPSLRVGTMKDALIIVAVMAQLLLSVYLNECLKILDHRLLLELNSIPLSSELLHSIVSLEPTF